MFQLKTDISNLFRVSITLVFFAAFFLGAVVEVFGQAPTKTYLKGEKTGDKIPVDIIPLGTGSANISAPMQEHANHFYYGPAGILNDTPLQYTTLRAAQDLGLLGILGAGGNVYIQFRNTNNDILTAGTTTYFKLGGLPTISGISLDVTGLLGLTTESAVYGQGYIGAGNYNLGADSANEGSPSGTATTKILIDNSGDYHAAVTPNSNYNSVRLNVSLPNSLRVARVLRSIEVQVYNAYIETTGGICSILGRYTSPPEVGGIALNTGVLGLDLNDLIANPHFALTADEQYASYSSGLLNLGVASTISQTIYFDHKATSNDSFYAKFSLNTASISVELLELNGISFTAYNGDSQVWSGNLNSIASLLGLNLLDILTIGEENHTPIEITAKPGVQFDRIKVTFDQGILGLGVLGDAFRLYNVSLSPSAPSIVDPNGNPTDEIICSLESAQFSVNAVNNVGNLTYQWQYFDGTSWKEAEGTNNTANYTITNVPPTYNGRLYRVEITGGNEGCTQKIYSSIAELKVIAPPGKPQLNLTYSN